MIDHSQDPIMLNSLENNQFFSADEISRLHELGLWHSSNHSPVKLAFAALMLSPIMQIDQLDDMTSQSEFTVLGEFVHKMEVDFELASEEDLESIGTDMGMLPMVGGGWKTEQFLLARALLAGAIERLTEEEAHEVRTALARGALDISRAGSGHLINLHTLPNSQRPLLRSIVTELRLGGTAEGLRILGMSSPK